jgi:zinc protease
MRAAWIPPIGAVLCTAAIALTAHAETRLPEVEHITLDNGLQVLLLPNEKNPLVEIHFLARAGTAIEPASQDGTVSMMAASLTGGTPSMDEAAIAEAIAAIGATLHASADLDTVELSGSVITFEADDLQRFLAIFADVLLHASFPDDVVQRNKKLRISAVQGLIDQHADLADAALDAMLYGDAPRGRLGIGSLGTLPTILPASLRQVRDALLIPQHSILAVAGHFDRDEMLSWIEDVLSDRSWGDGACVEPGLDGRCARLCVADSCYDNPEARPLVTKPPPRDEPAGPRVLLVDRDDPSISQIQWRLGMDNPVSLEDPRWGAFRLGTQILGGDFTARLNRVLRVQEGLTYGAHFRVSYGKHRSGPMKVSTYVSPADLERALALTHEVIASVRSGPMPIEEIDGFKGKIINAFPFKFETVSSTLAQFLYLTAAGIPIRWLAEYTDRIAAPTAAEVHEVLQLLDPARMVLVAVGNRDLVPVLRSMGPVAVVKARDFLTSGLETLQILSEAPGATP